MKIERKHEALRYAKDIGTLLGNMRESNLQYVKEIILRGLSFLFVTKV